MVGETKDHTTEKKRELPSSSSFDEVRNVIRPDGSCDYRDEKGHDDNTLDDAELHERVKNASNYLSRKRRNLNKRTTLMGMFYMTMND